MCNVYQVAAARFPRKEPRSGEQGSNPDDQTVLPDADDVVRLVPASKRLHGDRPRGTESSPGFDPPFQSHLSLQIATDFRPAGREEWFVVCQLNSVPSLLIPRMFYFLVDGLMLRVFFPFPGVLGIS